MNADSGSGRWWNICWLILLLGCSEGLYLAVWRFSLIYKDALASRFLVCVGVLFLLYAASYFLLRRHAENARPQLLIIAIGAVLFRASLLGAGMEQASSASDMARKARLDVQAQDVTYGRFLLFDDDTWRYLWDGHVLAHGINPYQYTPNSHELDNLAEDKNNVWREIRANVNHPDLPTIYPPLAEGVFRVAHWIGPGSILVWKGIVSSIDLIAVLFLALTLRTLKLPVTAVILYAWNPLVIISTSGSGHMDSLTAATLAATAYFLARKLSWQAALSFALAVSSKLAPLLLLPFIAKRLSRKGMMLSAVFLLGMYLPFLNSRIFESLKIFVYQWQFNSAWFVTLEWCLRPVAVDPSYWARVLSGLILLVAVIRLYRNDQGDIQGFLNAATTSLGLLLLLSPTVMPWYVLWLLPAAVAGQKHIWIYFSGFVCLSVLMMKDWQPQVWVLALEYGAFLCAILWSFVQNIALAQRLWWKDWLSRVFPGRSDEMIHVPRKN